MMKMEVEAMKRAKIVVLNVLLALLLGACSESEQAVTPAEVAADFWTAVQMGDQARAEQLAVPGSLAGSMMNFDRAGHRIDSITFGEAMASADMAAVPTTVVGEFDNRPMTFSFDTRLVPLEGRWRVDFNTTNTGMMGAMLKQAMSVFSEVMAEGVEQAMTEIGVALAEGADVLAEGLREGLEQGASGLSQGLDAASAAIRTSVVVAGPVALAARVSGQIKGLPVQLTASEWDGQLAIYQGDSWGSEPSLLFFLFLPEGELPIERNITVANDEPPAGHPHVHYRWRDASGDIQTQVLTDGYNLRLEFGRVLDGQVDGQINFSVPGEETRLQGEFSLRID